MDKSKLEELLASMVRSEASTLHLVAGHTPCMRVQGNLVVSEDEADVATPLGLEELSREFLFDDHRAKVDAGEEVQILYSSQTGARFRTSVIRGADGLNLVFRRIRTTVPSIEDLSLPPLLRSFVEFRSGLVLVTGFLGSGKTTTLASLLQEASATRDEHIVTIEGNIEYIFNDVRSLVHQREVGVHVDSYHAGIREACHHGAGLVLVSELRGIETLKAVLDACERGALVLTSMHASSVVAALSEMIQLAPADDRRWMRRRVAESLRAVVSQVLLNRPHGKGRVPLLEILVNNQNVSRVLRSNDLNRLGEVMQRSRGIGMQTSDMGLRHLLQRNLISEEEALYHAVDRERVLAKSRPSMARSV